MRVVLNAIAGTSAVFAGVLFLRFWRESVDRLFLWFAVAFAMFACNYFVLALVPPGDENRFFAYLPRLAGFVLLLVAIADHNRR